MGEARIQLGELMSAIAESVVVEADLHFLPEDVFADAIILASSLPAGSRHRFCVELIAYMRRVHRLLADSGRPLVLQLAALLRRMLEEQPLHRGLDHVLREMLEEILLVSSRADPTLPTRSPALHLATPRRAGVR